jgi:TPR repeat protein
MSTSESAMNPALPTLYFTNQGSSEEQPTLQSLAPELLHRCLTQFADWGDLAKIACVQKSWSTLVKDAAEFGGRDAKWELSMVLLGQDESTSESGEEQAENECAKNCRGMAKNEALAVKYLTEISGVGVGQDEMANEVELTYQGDAKSSLPTDWSVETDTNADEAALLTLAKCHMNGTGVTSPNPKLALHYLQAAFHYTKSVKSAHTLALMYEYPKESNNLVPIDVYAAFEWFKAAAELGHVPSMAELALCYELGCGTVQNDNAALDWYMKAANSGHGASHYSVGEHYEEARGVPLDHEEACLWYHRAAVMGEQDGVSGLKRLRHVARRVLSANNLQELAEQHELGPILHE